MDLYTRLIEELGQSLGLGTLAADAEGGCSIAFDGELAVELRHDTQRDALVLFAAIGELDEAGRAALAPAMLDANLFWQRTAGATLGVSSTTGLAVLCRREPLTALDLPKLRAMLEQFLDAAQGWQSAIAAQRSAAAAPASAPAAIPFSAPIGIIRG